jgi:cytochrome c553
MTKMKKLLLIAGLCLLGTAHAAGDVDAGKAKSASCAACHMADGNSAAPMFPKIAGQHAAYAVKQLQEFKSGDRVDATMNPMAAALTDEDIADLAAYFGAQEPRIGSAAADKVELGGAVYRAGNMATGVAACAACHGPTGEGNPMARFPALSGQHADYTVAQLKAFRSGARANDANAMMRAVARKMSDAEIEAVAQYIQGLH